VPVQKVPCEPTIITAWRPFNSADGAFPAMASAGADNSIKAKAARAERIQRMSLRRV
jgi:hypothetical protein